MYFLGVCLADCGVLLCFTTAISIAMDALEPPGAVSGFFLDSTVQRWLGHVSRLLLSDKTNLS